MDKRITFIVHWRMGAEKDGISLWEKVSQATEMSRVAAYRRLTLDELIHVLFVTWVQPANLLRNPKLRES